MSGVLVEPSGQFGNLRGAFLTGPVASLATDLADAVLTDDFSTAKSIALKVRAMMAPVSTKATA